jgi:hypothetical protein
VAPGHTCNDPCRPGRAVAQAAPFAHMGALKPMLLYILSFAPTLSAEVREHHVRTTASTLLFSHLHVCADSTFQDMTDAPRSGATRSGEVSLTNNVGVPFFCQASVRADCGNRVALERGWKPPRPSSEHGRFSERGGPESQAEGQEYIKQHQVRGELFWRCWAVGRSGTLGC